MNASRMPQKKPEANPLQQVPADHSLALGIQRRLERKVRLQQLSDVGRHSVQTKMKLNACFQETTQLCEVTLGDALPLKVILTLHYNCLTYELMFPFSHKLKKLLPNSGLSSFTVFRLHLQESLKHRVHGCKSNSKYFLKYYMYIHTTGKK